MLSMFKEGDGKYSFSRVSVSVILLFYFFFATIITIETLEIPDIPVQLAGLAAILYGVNKVSKALSRNGG